LLAFAGIGPAGESLLKSGGAYHEVRANEGQRPRVWFGQDGKPLPFQSDEEILDFLRGARVASIKKVPQGITEPRQVVLEKDGVRARAIFRDLDQVKDAATLGGKTFRRFRDSYLFECAAYELGRMLGLENIPPVVERTVEGRQGSLQMWLEGAMMERDRREQKLRAPNVILWNKQLQAIHVFDNLIFNVDRSQENLLIDKEWNLWMIDHTRAFVLSEELSTPAALYQCPRGLWEKLKNLEEKEAERRLRPYLKPNEIDSLLKRRKKLIAHFQKEIEKRGESDVLYEMN
jgi:hypothetical protein